LVLNFVNIKVYTIDSQYCIIIKDVLNIVKKTNSKNKAANGFLLLGLIRKELTFYKKGRLRITLNKVFKINNQIKTRKLSRNKY